MALHNIFSAFANVANGQRLATSDGLGSFIVNYGAGSAAQSEIKSWAPAGAFPGDYNANGVVDAADYVLWRNGGPLQNEVDTPGVVNAGNYGAWRSRFGNTGGGSGASANAAVPEPATCVLLVIAATGLCPQQRRNA